MTLKYFYVLYMCGAHVCVFGDIHRGGHSFLRCRPRCCFEPGHLTGPWGIRLVPGCWPVSPRLHTTGPDFVWGFWGSNWACPRVQVEEEVLPFPWGLDSGLWPVPLPAAQPSGTALSEGFLCLRHSLLWFLLSETDLGHINNIFLT